MNHKKFLCGHDNKYLKRSEKHDAYYCEECDAWIEAQCPEGCDFCTGRPDKPSEVEND